MNSYDPIEARPERINLFKAQQTQDKYYAQVPGMRFELLLTTHAAYNLHTGLCVGRYIYIYNLII